MKTKIAILLLLFPFLIHSQPNDSYEFGKITREEAELTSYKKALLILINQSFLALNMMYCNVFIKKPSIRMQPQLCLSKKMMK